MLLKEYIHNQGFDSNHSKHSSVKLRRGPSFGSYVNLRNYMAQSYHRIVSKRGFHRALSGFLIVQALLQLINVLVLVTSATNAAGLGKVAATVVGGAEKVQESVKAVAPGWMDHLLQKEGSPYLVNAVQIFSSSASTVLTLTGVWFLRRQNRARAYLWFQRSMQVQIYVTQVCVLYHSSLRAIGGLLISVAVAVALSFMLHYEENNSRSVDKDDADGGNGEEMNLIEESRGGFTLGASRMSLAGNRGHTRSSSIDKRDDDHTFADV